MRYVVSIVALLIAAFFFFLAAINLVPLGIELFLNVSLPWRPLGVLVMPVWMALLFAFAGGFAAAVILEVFAWYEYERTIRLQRRQIRGLQEKLGRSAKDKEAT